MSEGYKEIQLGNRPVLPVDLGVWGTIKFDPNSDNPSYIGMHINRSANETIDDWRVYKFYGTTEIQVAHGSYSARTLLF
jgi:hypothetical protein